MSDERIDPLPEDALDVVRAERTRPPLGHDEIASIRRAAEQRIFAEHDAHDMHSQSFPPAARARAHRLQRGSVFAIGALAGAAALAIVVGVREVREHTLLLGHGSVAAVDANASETMLQAARGALGSGRAQAALELVELHARNFASAPESEARDAVRVEALLELGRANDAQAAFARFVAAYPGSRYVSSLRARLPH